MDATIRATCPGCGAGLKIPARWAGQAVKCKKCGSLVRTKAPPVPPAAPPQPAPVPATPATVPVPEPSPFAELAAPPVSQYNPFEDAAAPPSPVGYGPAPYATPPAYPAASPYPYSSPAPAPAGPYSVPAPGYPAAVSAPHPGYPALAPVATAPAAEFAPELAPSEATATYRRSGRRGGKGRYVGIGVAVLLLGGIATAGVFWDKVKQPLGSLFARAGTPDGGQPAAPAAGAKGGKGLTTAGVPLPRRLLFIHISNYLYLNPLTGAAANKDGIKGPDKTKGASLRLGYELRVPMDKDNNQLFLLSDTAPPPDHRTPMKGVVTGTYEKFFETSRPQDRVAVYFGGHALVREGKAFLVPIEGDPDDEASLIPLADFYAKLGACPATQKVVIWDVCRFNPQRGALRPAGSEPLSEELAKALAAPPPGVQAVLTCQPGEHALEFNDFEPDGGARGTISVSGSSFLASARFVADKALKGGAKPVSPDDPLPVGEWAGAVGKQVNEVAAKFPDPKFQQHVTVAGTAPETLTAYKADEPAAARFEFPKAPQGASPAEVLAIAREFTLPPLNADTAPSGVSDFPFPAEALAPYKADVPVEEIMNPANREKYAFRANVIEAFETIRKVWGKEGATQIRKEFTGATDDTLKKGILKEQLFPAEAIPRLERAIALLEAVEPMKAEQPKRWQAHYEYALAQCKARLAYMHEYNLALGNIRTEVLPPKKEGDDGYKLVSVEKLKVKKEAKYAEEAKEHFQKLIDEFKGSPWAVQAKQDRGQSLGLAWQSFNSKAGEAKEPDAPKAP